MADFNIGDKVRCKHGFATGWAGTVDDIDNAWAGSAGSLEKRYHVTNNLGSMWFYQDELQLHQHKPKD